MIIRSTSVLNPVAGGEPVPASVRGVKLISPKNVARGESSDVMCSVSCPSKNPRGPSGCFVLAKLTSPNPEILRLGYSRALPCG